MQNQSTNNKRIAKNTIFLYVRMLITMAVGLFTSRIVLRTLGVEDYGIYNIVGGIVVLFNFVNQSLLSGTQRFLSYELGKSVPDIKTVFSACAKMHIGLSIIFFVLAETLGLWFVNTQLNVPEMRIVAVNWVYQFSVLGCIVQIIRCPYNAAIISYERMSIYAYISIIEAVLKLITALVLLIVFLDKLILYSFITFIVLTIISVIYIVYCHKNLPDVRIVKVKNNPYYKKIFNFSKWTIWGSLANMGKEQGLNLIINLFYGVALNAAVGIANQVNVHISSFVQGFQQALNPQLTKSEAVNDRSRQADLIFKSAKFSFMIMLAFAVPIMFNLDYLLYLWLGEYPEHTTSICYIIIIGVLFETLSGPLWVSIYATGRIKTYQIIIGIIALMNIPLSYISCKMGFFPEMVYVIRSVIAIVCVLTQLTFLRKYINLDIMMFINKVVIPISILILLILPLFYIKWKYFTHTNFYSFMLETIIILFYDLIIMVLIGLSKGERLFITQQISKMLKK